MSDLEELPSRRMTTQGFGSENGSDSQDESDEPKGGGCCGGGNGEAVDDEEQSGEEGGMNPSKSQSKALNSNEEDGEEGPEELTEEPSGGGCCGGGNTEPEAIDDEEGDGITAQNTGIAAQNTGITAQNTMTENRGQSFAEGIKSGASLKSSATARSTIGSSPELKSSAVLEEQQGGGCCSCGKAADTSLSHEPYDSDGEIEAVGSGILIEPDDAPDMEGAPPAPPVPGKAPSAESDEVEISIGEGIYFSFSPANGGSSSMVFSRKGLIDSVYYGRMNEYSKVPAFKFRGTGKTLLSDRCLATREELYKGLCLYAKGCRQYKVDICLFNPDQLPIPTEMLLLKIRDMMYDIVKVRVGKFYHLEEYDAVVCCADGAITGKWGKDFTISSFEATNAFIGAKSYRVDFQ